MRGVEYGHAALAGLGAVFAAIAYDDIALQARAALTGRENAAQHRIAYPVARKHRGGLTADAPRRGSGVGLESKD